MNMEHINRKHKVQEVEIVVSDYHLTAGMIVTVYFNKHNKHWKTICGLGYCGNWTVYESNFNVIKTIQ